MSYAFARVVGLVVGLAWLVATGGATARAALVTFAVDQAASSLSLSGQAFGLNYQPQVPGSLFGFWGGTIVADVTGGVFTFSGGSSITSSVSPMGPFVVNPSAANVAGAYGVTANGTVIGVPGTATVNGVYRDLVLNITAGSGQNGSAPTGMNLSFTSGALDFWAGNPNTIASSTSNLVGVAGVNNTISPLLFDGTTLTLPMTFRTVGSNRTEDWSGVVVARVVPEPGCGWVLVTVGCLSFMRRRGEAV